MPVIGYAINPSLFTARTAVVEIETHSELAKGQTVADRNAAGPSASICLDVDAEAPTAMFTEPLCRGLGRQRRCLVPGAHSHTPPGIAYRPRRS